MVEKILVFCAHSDDEAVGVAGTIAKYLKEGKKVIKVVFSFGQSSHPHYKEKVIIEKRVKESRKAADYLGIHETFFLGLTDGKVREEIEKYNVKDKIKKIIRKYKPKKIFMPSSVDPHPDHRAVNKLVLEVVDELKTKPELYSFEVWNLIKENKPILYVDISPHFKKKIAFMKTFKSQKHFILPLIWPAILRARWYGLKNNCRYAEKFYKVR